MNNLTNLSSVSQSSNILSPNKLSISQSLLSTAQKQSKSIKQELRGDDLVNNTTQIKSVCQMRTTCSTTQTKSDASGARKQYQSRNQLKLDKDTLVKYQFDQISRLFLSKVNQIRCHMAGNKKQQPLNVSKKSSSLSSSRKQNVSKLTDEEANVLKILQLFKRMYRVEDDIFIIGLVFLDKIQESLTSGSDCADQNNQLLNDTFKLLVMTLTLSSKCYYDKFECETQFSIFAKVNKSQFRRLMLQYLELIDYRLFVSSENFTYQLGQINTLVVQCITSQGINAVQIVRPEIKTEASKQSKQEKIVQKHELSKKVNEPSIVTENPCDITMASSDQQQYQLRKSAEKVVKAAVANDDQSIIMEIEGYDQTSLKRI